MNLIKFITILYIITTILPLEGSYICNILNQDLCLGFSEGGTKLQVKSRLGLYLRLNESSNLEIGDGFEYGNGSFLVVEGPYIKLGEKTNLIWGVNSTVQLNETDLCVTVMECKAEGNGFCSSLVNKISDPVKMKTGSYVKILPCRNLTQQQWVVNPECLLTNLTLSRLAESRNMKNYTIEEICSVWNSVYWFCKPCVVPGGRQ